MLVPWLTASGTNGLSVYAPGRRLLNDGYQGSLTLQAIEVLRDQDTGEVISYSIQYAETDRPVTKGGQVDPDAVVVGRAFDLFCGPLVAALEPHANETVAELGDCMVVAPRGELDAEMIAGSLVLIAISIE